jgi:hypothetical protein
MHEHWRIQDAADMECNATANGQSLDRAGSAWGILRRVVVEKIFPADV